MTIPASDAPADATAALKPTERATKVPYDEVDRLLVEGELVTGEDGVVRRVWPSQREIARRYGVAPSLVGAFSSARECRARREAFVSGKEVAPVAPASRIDASSGEDSRRGPGRPRRGDGPSFPHDQVFDALVYGEIVPDEHGKSNVSYPSYRDLAQRYGVTVSVIAEYAKSRNVLKRRELARARYESRKEEKLIELRSEAVAFDEAKMLQVIDSMCGKFASAADEGRMRFDNVADFDKLWRLRSFIQGGPDSRQELQGSITLEALQQRHEMMLRNTRDVTIEMTGYVPRARIVDGIVVHEAVTDDEGALVTASRPPARATESADRKPIAALLSLIPRIVERGRVVCAMLDAETAADSTLPEVQLLALLDEAEELSSLGAEVSAHVSSAAAYSEDAEDESS
jgi:hypothetical protein